MKLFLHKFKTSCADLQSPLASTDSGLDASKVVSMIRKTEYKSTPGEPRWSGHHHRTALGPVAAVLRTPVAKDSAGASRRVSREDK